MRLLTFPILVLVFCHILHSCLFNCLWRARTSSCPSFIPRLSHSVRHVESLHPARWLWSKAQWLYILGSHSNDTSEEKHVTVWGYFHHTCMYQHTLILHFWKQKRRARYAYAYKQGWKNKRVIKSKTQY